MPRGLSLLLLLAVSACAQGEPSPLRPTAPASAATTRASIDPATVRASLDRAASAFEATAVEGAYAWACSVDGRHRYGETALGPAEGAVQPPGTPAVGETWLRAYRATGDRAYLERARRAGQALARGQLPFGGWDYVLSPAPRDGLTTFDDDTTQSAVRFLIRLVAALEGASANTGDETVRAALDRALSAVVAAQYPNGGWPQRWDGRRHRPADHPGGAARIPETYPRQHPRSPYYGHYTLNDHAHRDLLLTLRLAVRHTRRPDVAQAYARGLAFVREAQLPEPQAGWAQQYNIAMEPAWARAFEPPAVSAAESGQLVRLLVDLYLEDGDASLLTPVGPALEWLRRSRLPSGEWARLYELGTNQPLYGDRDGRLHTTLEEISAERRSGYRWQGDFDIPETLARADGVLAEGREAWLRRHPGWSFDGDEPATMSRKREARAITVIESLDTEGRWTSPARGQRAAVHPGLWIESAVFNANVRLLCDVLEARNTAAPRETQTVLP